MFKYPIPRKDSKLVKQLKEMERKSKYIKPKPIIEIKQKDINISSLKSGMVIKHKNFVRLWVIDKVLRVNINVLPYPTLPSDSIQQLRKTELNNYEIVK